MMKSRIVLILVLSIMIFLTSVQGQSIDEPRFVNRMLSEISAPTIIPGRDGVFSLKVCNPDPVNLTGPMTNTTLEISIYRYLTLSDDKDIAEISHPPVILGSGNQSIVVDCGEIYPGSSVDVNLTITTLKDTPHGSYFSQSTYLVRFRLSFDYGGQRYVMASRGYFTDEEWARLKAGDGAGKIDQDYLHELGYDGIIPDSGFSLRKPIPRWPFYILLGITCFTGFMAVYFHVLDNPNKYPRLEKRFLRLGGWFETRMLVFSQRLLRRKPRK